MMPLGLLCRDERAEVVEVGGANKTSGSAVKDRLGHVEDLGLRAGKVVMVLSNEGRGPVLLKVDESRIALGRGMAMRILVRRIGS